MNERGGGGRCLTPALKLTVPSVPPPRRDVVCGVTSVKAMPSVLVATNQSPEPPHITNCCFASTQSTFGIHFVASAVSELSGEPRYVQVVRSGLV